MDQYRRNDEVEHARPAPGRRLNRRRLVAAAAAAVGAQRLPLVGAARGQGPAHVKPVAAAAQEFTPVSRFYFASTGHNLAEPFLSAWRNFGGEEALGPPLSEERYAAGAGGVLQTFANATLVYDPVEDAGASPVRMQALDESMIASLAPSSAIERVGGCSATAGVCQHFPQTGHTVSGRIAEYWASTGGQAVYGLPVTESFFDDSGKIVQLFEYAILEDGGVEGVTRRPLGTLLVEQGGLANDPAFKPAPPTGGTTFLVDAEDGLRLRGGPDPAADIVQVLPNNAEFIAAGSDTGEWVPGYADGFAGWVSSSFLTQPPPLPQFDPASWNPAIWQGASLGETNVRAEPTTTARVVEELVFGDPITVTEWVAGEEVFEGADLWAKLGEGRYVYARNVGRNAPVVPITPPPDAPTWGKWIDVHLTQQLMTAYDGMTPVRTIVVTTGMAGWETPPGLFYILHRVANETMTNDAIGAEHYYKLEDVLFTQYFTDFGHALHFAWWRTPETIGRPGSHGCINMLLDDSRFMWDWADIGTPILIRR